MSQVDLAPIGPQHVASLAPVLDDPDVQRFTRVPVPVPDGFASEWLARYVDGRAAGTAYGWAVLDGTGEFAGFALAMNVDREAGQAELGYLVAPAARGRGVATAILLALTDWAFGEAGLHRVELRIEIANEPSLRVARRCGFLHEGTLRSTWLKPGFDRVDTTIWSRLATDGD